MNFQNFINQISPGVPLYAVLVTFGILCFRFAKMKSKILIIIFFTLCLICIIQIITRCPLILQSPVFSQKNDTYLDFDKAKKHGIYDIQGNMRFGHGENGIQGILTGGGGGSGGSSYVGGGGGSGGR